MPPLEWRALHVELSAEAGDELADGCRKLTSEGWQPAFIVPVFHSHFQILANRTKKSIRPPSLPAQARPRSKRPLPGSTK